MARATPLNVTRRASACIFEERMPGENQRGVESEEEMLEGEELLMDLASD